MKLLISSNNQDKIKEIRAIFKLPDVDLVTLDDITNAPFVIEDGNTLYDNAFKKASMLHKFSGIPTIADARSPNTVRSNLKSAVRRISINWKAFIDLDKIKLHKYFLKNGPPVFGRLPYFFIRTLRFTKKVFWKELSCRKDAVTGDLVTIPFSMSPTRAKPWPKVGCARSPG